MKSFVEQSERHYVSVPRHHLWSRIYIILRVFVFHIYVVYVRVCMYISMCLRVCGPCVCVSVYYDTLVFSLVFSLALFHSRFVLSLFSLIHCPLTLVLSRFSRALCRIYARTSRSFPPAFLSLLPNIPRVLLPLSFSMYRYPISIWCEIALDSEEENRAKSNEDCNFSSFDFASWVDDQ